MRLVRAIFTLVVAASLAVLPARVGAIGLFGGSGTVVSAVADCASMDDASCQPEQRMSADAGDMTTMPNGCDRTGDHRMLPGACSTYCNSLPALPTIVAITADAVLIALIAPAIGMMRDGIGVSPEPHPPKRV